MTTTSKSFNPVDYGFRWTDDGWYEYDGRVAENKALKARNDYAAEQRRAGKTVKKSTSKHNLISKGGIGSGYPHIELVVPVYRVLVIG